MFRLLYNLLFHVVYLMMLPKFLLRMRKRGGYRADFGERVFRLSEEKIIKLSESRKIWIHAVSVGEFGVARSFMKEWRARHPDDGFVITVNTSTGHALAEEALTGNDVLLYPPLDSPLIVRKALDFIQPRALILVETEMWPNLIWGCRKRNIPVMLLNGRISDRSYGRLQKVGFFTRRMYPLVDRFCMQSKADAQRVKNLGAPEDHILALHSVKYDGMTRDLEAETTRKTRLLQCGFLKEDSRIILGSSTWPGEEKVLMESFKEIREEMPEVRLILVPRHAERREEILTEARDQNLNMVCWSTASDEEIGLADVVLVDTTGELKHFTGFADRVVVGKSLFRSEGQNPLEAANAGKWMVTGPGMKNFRQVMADLRNAEAVMEITEADELQSALLCSLVDDEAASAQGLRARQVVESHKGGLSRSVEVLEEVLSPWPSPCDSTGRHAKPQRCKDFS